MRQALPVRLDVPIVAAPMFLVSSPELVIAAARSGILGAFPAANCRDIDELDRWLQLISTSLSSNNAPARGSLWAVNLITHRSNAMLGEQIECVMSYRPPVVISAMGSPKPLQDAVSAYDGLLFADVTNLPLAQKAIDAGVDGLICVSAGAGGHTGRLSPFAFASAVRRVFDGTIAVGGGISDGFGVAGAIAAGADLAVIGTRFIATKESLAADGHKQMLIESGSADIIVTSRITGASASWLRGSLIANGLDADHLPDLQEVDLNKRPKRWSELWSAGDGVGGVLAVESVSAVVAELKKEFREAATRLSCIAEPPRPRGLRPGGGS